LQESIKEFAGTACIKQKKTKIFPTLRDKESTEFFIRQQ
jgi:hypothetical protein